MASEYYFDNLLIFFYKGTKTQIGVKITVSIRNCPQNFTFDFLNFDNTKFNITCK